MRIIKYLQLPFFFDAGLLQQETDALSAMHWQPHYQVKHYEGAWNGIPLRSVNGKVDDLIISPADNQHYLDTIFLDNSPYFRKVLQQFQCTLQAVRLLKLNAGSIIKEHRDAELNFENGEIRLHIPVCTHADVEFVLDKETLELKAGECWYMNFNLPHSVQNKSSKARIHLVIDAIVNDWVKEIFERPAALKKEIEAPGFDETTTRQIILQLRQLNTGTGNRMADEMEAGIQPVGN